MHLQFIDLDHPVVELGDISIYVIADGYVKRNEKVAILANDRKLNDKFKDSKNIMVLDYKSNLLNQL